MQQQLFEKFAAYVEARFGIRLPDEKKTLLETRLFKLFSSSQEPELADEESFFAYLCQDQSGRADNILADAITTNHTFFMREKDHFAYFSEAVLPYWAEHSPERDLRTWCAACSTGEEAYTLAMLIQDFFALKTGWDVSLLATDLSREALAAARSGSYDRHVLRELPVSWQRLYFQPDGAERVRITDALRAQIIYRQFNLMEPHFPFRRRFHVIFCRNVMIYFDAPTREALVRKFYEFLEPGGVLLIGHSEVIDRNTVPFAYVMPSVYRRM